MKRRERRREPSRWATLPPATDTPFARSGTLRRNSWRETTLGKRERDALAQVPLFSGLSPRHLKRLSDVTEEQRFMEGANVVREGEDGDAFFVIVEGEAKVVAPSGRVVNRLMPGEYFGEISLLDGGPRTATIVAETPLRTITLSRDAFLKTVQSEPAVAVRLLNHAAAMLRRLERSTAS
jgi:CRP/FNR family cyclic AMP-dependent transcriptional regulator